MIRQLLTRRQLHNMLKADAMEKGNRVWDVSVVIRGRVLAGPFYSTDQLASKLGMEVNPEHGLPDGWIVDMLSPNEWRLYLRVGESYSEEGRRGFTLHTTSQPPHKSIFRLKIALKSEQEYVRLVALHRNLWWQAPFTCPYCEAVWWSRHSAECSHLICWDTRVLESHQHTAFRELFRNMSVRQWTSSIQNSNIDGLTIKLPRRNFNAEWFRHAWWYVQKISTMRHVEAAMLENHQTQIIAREDESGAPLKKTLLTRQELSDLLLTTLKRGGERVWEVTVHMDGTRLPLPLLSTSTLALNVMKGGPQSTVDWGAASTHPRDIDGWLSDQPGPREWRLYLRHGEHYTHNGYQWLQTTVEHAALRPDRFIRLLALPRELWWHAPFVCPCCQTLHPSPGAAAKCEHLLAAEDVVMPAYTGTRFAALFCEMWQKQWTCGVQNSGIDGFRIKIARVHGPGEWIRTAYWYIRDPSVLPLLEAFMEEARRTGTPAALPSDIAGSPVMKTGRDAKDSGKNGDEDEDDDGFDIGGLVLA